MVTRARTSPHIMSSPPTVSTEIVTDEIQAKIDAAFPPHIDTVYVVHAGEYRSKENTSEQMLARPVCTRIVKADADEIATYLNEAHDRDAMVRWAASICFDKLRGGSAQLEAAVADPEVRALWDKECDKRFKGKCPPIFTVAELKLVDDEQKATLNEMLAENSSSAS